MPLKLAIQGAGENVHEPDVMDEDGVALEPAAVKPKRPPMYKVLLINDDYTPMEFVVHILQRFFRMSLDKAVQLMLAIHTQGRGVCGVFTREIAETKVGQVNNYSRSKKHPLLCRMEED